MTIPNLPVRCIDLGNPAEKSAHDEIVKKVEKMLALQNERQSVKPEEDLDRARAISINCANRSTGD